MYVCIHSVLPGGRRIYLTGCGCCLRVWGSGWVRASGFEFTGTGVSKIFSRLSSWQCLGMWFGFRVDGYRGSEDLFEDVILEVLGHVARYVERHHSRFRGHHVVLAHLRYFTDLIQKSSVMIFTTHNDLN